MQHIDFLLEFMLNCQVCILKVFFCFTSNNILPFFVMFMLKQELESELAAKQASLPKEPLQNDEGAVTVVVRMPDGSRRGRRFLKSDKLQVSFFQLPASLLKCFIIPASNLLELLQYLFDFIDISRTFKPGTYRLVILIHFF